MKYPYVDLGFFPHQLRMLKMLVHMSTNLVWLIAHVLLHLSSTVDTNPRDAFKSYDEIEGSALFLLSMLKKNVEVFASFLFMIFVFNFRMIFCPILTFKSSLFIVNSILTFYRYCFCFIYTDIAYMIYYNFLVVLTNSLSNIPSKLGSCFYVFQTMFLIINFLHPTENWTPPITELFC